MGSEHPDQPDRTTAAPAPNAAVRTEYLDLDDDGVPDAVEQRETFEYETLDGAEIVEEIREVDADIAEDGVPATVTVTDTVLVDTDRDGAPDAAEVTSITVHAEPETVARPATE